MPYSLRPFPPLACVFLGRLPSLFRFEAVFSILTSGDPAVELHSETAVRLVSVGAEGAVVTVGDASDPYHNPQSRTQVTSVPCAEIDVLATWCIDSVTQATAALLAAPPLPPCFPSWSPSQRTFDL
jgi:hypothetical protein